MVKLLAPKQSPQRLAVHHASVVGKMRRSKAIEVVGFLDARQENIVDIGDAGVSRMQTKTQHLRFAGIQTQMIYAAGLSACLVGVDGACFTIYQVAVEGVFDERLRVGRVPEALRVALVLGEQ